MSKIRNILIELFKFILFFATIMGVITEDLFIIIFYGISFLLVVILQEVKE